MQCSRLCYRVCSIVLSLRTLGRMARRLHTVLTQAAWSTLAVVHGVPDSPVPAVTLYLSPTTRPNNLWNCPTLALYLSPGMRSVLHEPPATGCAGDQPGHGVHGPVPVSGGATPCRPRSCYRGPFLLKLHYGHGPLWPPALCQHPHHLTRLSAFPSCFVHPHSLWVLRQVYAARADPNLTWSQLLYWPLKGFHKAKEEQVRAAAGEPEHVDGLPQPKPGEKRATQVCPPPYELMAMLFDSLLLSCAPGGPSSLGICNFWRLLPGRPWLPAPSVLKHLYGPGCHYMLGDPLRGVSPIAGRRNRSLFAYAQHFQGLHPQICPIACLTPPGCSRSLTDASTCFRFTACHACSMRWQCPTQSAL